MPMITHSSDFQWKHQKFQQRRVRRVDCLLRTSSGGNDFSPRRMARSLPKKAQLPASPFAYLACVIPYLQVGAKRWCYSSAIPCPAPVIPPGFPVGRCKRWLRSVPYNTRSLCARCPSASCDVGNCVTCLVVLGTSCSGKPPPTDLPARFLEFLKLFPPRLHPAALAINIRRTTASDADIHEFLSSPCP